jgi:hypothetical protein
MGSLDAHASPCQIHAEVMSLIWLDQRVESSRSAVSPKAVGKCLMA